MASNLAAQRRQQEKLGALQKRWKEASDGVTPAPSLTLSFRVAAFVIASNLRIGLLAHEIGVSERTLYNLRDDPGDRTRTSIGKIVAWINLRLRPHHKITPEEFLNFDPVGGEAVSAFVRWLSVDQPARRIWSSFLPSPKELYFASSPARLLKVRETLDFLARQDLRSVKVIHQEGMAEGLRAFASHLVHAAIPQDSRLDDRDVCYLPVTRLPKSQERVTFPKLVGFLAAFYSGQNAQEARSPRDADELRKQLDEIRTHMQIRPTIFILDGHNALRDALPDLQALIADDALVAFLREALHPQVGALFPGPRPQSFYGNRFLILADHEVSGFDSYADTAERLPNPPSKLMRRVLKGQARKNLDQLVDLHRGQTLSDAVTGVAAEVLSLRAEGLQSRAFRWSNLSSLTEAYDELVRILKRRNPTALFALRLLGLCRGGLRYATFIRLTEQWNRLRGFDPQQHPSLRVGRSEKDVADMLADLGDILVHGQDEEIPGYDGLPEFFVYLDDQIRGVGVRAAEASRKSFDLRAAGLRDAILADLLGEEDYLVQRMHRILAEEALRQQTLIMRHADWRGSADVRYYRRLCQMLFHGYLSLPANTQSAAVSPPKALEALPSNPEQLYRQLYGEYFRTLLEHPPHFDLSRTLGRDALKRDLLLLAMNAGRSPETAAAARTELKPRRSPYLPTTGPDAIANIRILLEQLVSLARASFQTDDKDLCGAAIEEFDKSIEDFERLGSVPSNPGWDAELREQRLKMAKVRIDLALQSDVGGAEAAIVEAFRLSPSSGLLQETVARWQEGVNKSANRETAERRLADAGELLEIGKVRSVAQLSNWSDLLARQGEVAARKADGAEGADRAVGLFKAFQYFVAAEHFRRLIQSADVLGRTYVVNNHSCRVMVRTALQIVRALDAHDPRGRSPRFATLPSRAYFVVQAKAQIDLMTRFSSRYPSERPSLLILQATFTRSLRAKADNITSALQLLAEADSLMFNTPDRPRVRRRLLLERIKVLRMLVRASAESRLIPPGESAPKAPLEGSPSHWTALAIYDLIRLRRLVGRTTGVWAEAVLIQTNRLRTLMRVLRVQAAHAGVDANDWNELVREAQRMPAAALPVSRRKSSSRRAPGKSAIRAA